MARKRATVNVSGMNRDMAKSLFDPKFTFENKNIRITARDEANTSYAVTNEKGTRELADVTGTPVGVFTCNEYLGVFSFDGDTDYVTVYEKKEEDGKSVLAPFFVWSGTGLDFDECKPETNRIETLVSVEASNSIRVYWVDGVHQPRVMDFMRLYELYGESCDSTKVDADYFGFLPVIQDIDKVEVSKNGSGYFYTGTVQFAITEVVNGNESNIAYYSPLYYVSDDANNRGYAPDNQTSGCSFGVSFECSKYSSISYFIVYAIYRSTQNGAALVFKREVGAAESVSTVLFGNEEAVDSSRLLFLNRQPMLKAKTIEQKDGVLFIGGWEGDESDRSTEDKHELEVSVIEGTNGKKVALSSFSEAGCAINSQLKNNSFEIGHFKHNEHYLLGYQLCDKYGHWGTIKLVKDGEEKNYHTMTGVPTHNGSSAYLPYFHASKDSVDIDKSKYKKIRPVVAYLDDAQKPALYQGMVTPTIYCEKERVEGTCYAKLSPFTRSFRYWKEGTFKPSKLWCNPSKIVTNSGVKSLSTTAYEEWPEKDNEKIVHSFLGYNPTCIDAEETNKTSMQYGTYPAAQHLQALGAAKDYNNEMQSAWRYREVVYKTALIPAIKRDGTSSGTSSKGATAVYEIDVSFNVIAEDLSERVSTSWIERVFVGINTDGDYTVLTCNNSYKIDKVTYETLIADSIADDVLNYVLWALGGTPSSCQSSLKGIICTVTKTDVDGTITYEGGTYNNGKLLFSNVIGSERHANAYIFGLSLTPFYTLVQSKVDDRQTAYDKEMEEKCQATFGDYIINLVDGSNSNDNYDVFVSDNTSYFVDASTLSFHSPDLSERKSVSYTAGKIEVVGAASMNGFVSDTQIVAESAKYSEYSGGTFGFQNLRPVSTTSGRCAMNLPNWNSAWVNQSDINLQMLWAVPPFGVSDYLAVENNEKTIENKVNSKLTYHQLSNYRFCSPTSYYNDSEIIECKGIQSADGAGVQMCTVGEDSFLYKASEDTELIPSLTQFWSNGPYYTVYNKLRERDSIGGIKPIAKFKNYVAGQNWQQIGYSCHWLRDADAGDSLNINLVCLMSQMNHPEKDRAYWRHGGTIDVENFPYENISLPCPWEIYQEGQMNDYDGGGITFDAYGINSDYGNAGKWDKDDDPRSYTTPLKYRSTPHAVISMDNPMWDYSQLASYAISKDVSFGNIGWKCDKGSIVVSDGWVNDKVPPTETGSDNLWIVDIVNNTGEPKFTPETAQWMIAGEARDITPHNQSSRISLDWKQGNWYYQRYECLRTYPESVEEKSQVVEIVSFMCETRRNIDGRYDSHGGKAFIQANPSNFFLVNDSYTQLNNFFSYSMPSENDNVSTSYQNTITWSTPKSLNANVDAWTSLSTESLLDLDGDKGPVTHLTRLQNNLLCFQPSGISQIMYNERTPLSVEDGTPVELAMSGKVEGKAYLANTFGALHNTNIVTTDNAIYFMDSYNKMLCALSQSIEPLSEKLGFHSWVAGLSAPALIRMYYDKRNGCVMGLDENEALVFSERASAFESFMSYEGTNEVASVQDMTVLIHKDETDEEGKYKLWEMNGGEYNKFFNVAKDYWIDMLIGGDQQRTVKDKVPVDKIFDNIEFRGDLLEDGDALTVKRCPFNTIRAYNEFQDSGEKPLKFDQYAISPLKNRFRSWFAYIPRNAERKVCRIMERMRNPWCHIVLLMRQPADGEEETGRAQIQELNVDYTE